MAEQELFDPIESITRIRVPTMDFNISPPLWESHAQGKRELFEWVLNDAVWAQSVHARPLSNNCSSVLKWAPFAPTAGRVSSCEIVDVPGDVLGCLDEPDDPLVSSKSYVRQGFGLRIAQLGSEDDLEALPEPSPHHVGVAAPPSVASLSQPVSQLSTGGYIGQ
jgi:hypothetical protein